MNLFLTMHGINKATFFFLPMLGKHPEEYPEFRDCFLSEGGRRTEYDGLIHIYTKAGGINRTSFKKEIGVIRAMPGYVTDYDDKDDSTFATFIFNIPAEWSDDYKLLKEVKLTEVSDEYYSRLCDVYVENITDFQDAFGRSN